MNKLDTSSNRQKELKDLIKLNKEVYQLNFDRITNLQTRYNSESSKLKLIFYKKIYKDIPVLLKVDEKYNELSFHDKVRSDINSFERSNIKLNDKSVRLLQISIDYNSWNTNPDYIFNVNINHSYSEDMTKLSTLLKYTTTVVDRINAFQDVFFKEYILLKKTYKTYINKYDTTTPLNIYETGEKQLSKIKDRLLLVLNQKYIFDENEYLRYSPRNGISVNEFIITKIMKINCEIEYKDNFSNIIKKKKFSIKDIIKIIREKKWHHELRYERKLKLKRVLKKNNK